MRNERRMRWERRAGRERLLPRGPHGSRGSSLVWLAVILAGPWAATAGAQAPPAKTTVESQVLVVGEPGLRYSISPAGQHLAAVVLRGSRQVMVHDGVDGPRFDQILNLPGASGGTVAWSDDGSRYAYHGRVAQEFVVMVDGKEVLRGPWPAELATSGQSPVTQLGFAPGGRHWYLVHSWMESGRARARLVHDGTAGPVTEGVTEPVFSPDGEHYAHFATSFPISAPQPTTRLMVDGKPAPYQAGNPQFTTDGLHLFTQRIIPRTDLTEVLADGQPFARVQGGIQLYMAPKGPGVLGVAWATPPNGARAAYLTVGNRRVPGSECTANAGLDAVVMTADAKHFAARCPQAWVMVDGKKGQEYPEGVSNVVFTADARAVYVGRTNGKDFLVVGDQESDGYATITPIAARKRADQGTANDQLPAVVSGNSVGFIANPNPSGLSSSTVVVVNGKSYPAPNAAWLTLSPDGSRWAVLTGQPYLSAMVDGVAHQGMTVDPNIAHIAGAAFHWSADSKHVAYASGNPNGLVFDGKLIPTPGMTRFLHFTADGRHLVWVVRTQTGGKHLIFVDGAQALELPLSADLENNSDLYWSFPEDGSIVFVAQDGEAIKRFRIVPGSGTSVDALGKR